MSMYQWTTNPIVNKFSISDRIGTRQNTLEYVKVSNNAYTIRNLVRFHVEANR
jgi:hypothetical protein